MDVTPIIDPLNDAQRDAVTAPQEPVLVVAGAGSGKTRVLVHRIAWLVEVEGVSPHGIMAVTFTNKAAAEMRGRVEQLLNMPISNLWIGTFHGLAHRLLRRHAEEVGLPKSFQILDSQDQQRMIRRIIKDMELDDSTWVAREVQWFINSQKDEGLRPDNLDARNDHTRAMLIRLYRVYQEACDQKGLVDFGELLLRAHELWLRNPDILMQYQRRFRHLLVDEFQDTNSVQYAWLRVLAGNTGTLFAVGDDDQSIYRWRGARVENMFQLKKEFPGMREIKLEQNYRSTATILNAANAIIANNNDRLGKNLWTDGNDGEQIKLYNAYNERDEAEFVIARIEDWISDGNLRADAAVLYRSNAQSRVFEERLLQKQVPYRVYGGLRFFERAEIKDALAYLRLLENRADDTSFERVVNLPTRGIGARTLGEIREYARANSISLWESAISNAGAQLSSRAGTAVHRFLELVENLARETSELQLHEQVDHVIERSELLAHFKKDRGEQAETRVENLEELVTAAQSFEPDEQDELPPLAAFLSHAALEAGEGQADKWEDCVQLMTLHSAKGLEFPLVFIAGMEEGLFPHKRSLNDPGGLEEERRLCYVGATRAMNQLYLSYAEQRRLHGVDNFAQASCFLAEIPTEYIEEVRPNIKVNRPAFRRENTIKVNTEPGMKLGQRVRHGKFGEGVVLNYEGTGSHARVQVNFEAAGTKWLVMSYANLELM
ncbi:MAG: DNA helicase II [Chromatiales bacterium]|jgi:DNA helicase-2/ATP-dependent DNA helicase PcrA|nr:DNA helicase II [Chromatiales bacterium]MDP6149677.1 DNA helicase II [Gammaproteobacteria bacterium]MDP7271032.1 DNA helicase II [Gammaproteobacteria bacterium]HJP04182.1 DNA helicase II [Gammaproteobacteria bacterium]